MSYEKCYGANGDARQDEIDSEEQCLSSDSDIELDIRVRLFTTRIILLILLGWNSE